MQTGANLWTSDNTDVTVAQGTGCNAMYSVSVPSYHNFGSGCSVATGVSTQNGKLLWSRTLCTNVYGQFWQGGKMLLIPGNSPASDLILHQDTTSSSAKSAFLAGLYQSNGTQLWQGNLLDSGNVVDQLSTVYLDPQTLGFFGVVGKEYYLFRNTGAKPAVLGKINLQNMTFMSTGVYPPLLANKANNTLHGYDILSEKILWTLSPVPFLVDSFYKYFRANSQYLLVVQNCAQIFMLDALNGKVVDKINLPIPGDPRSYSCSLSTTIIEQQIYLTFPEGWLVIYVDVNTKSLSIGDAGMCLGEGDEAKGV
jgi:hypothetical protein